MKSQDHIFKIIALGDSSVGKTSLHIRYHQNIFNQNILLSTIGVQFRIKTFEIDSNIVKLQIWDTAGQQRFRTLSAVFYKGVSGVILVYDICDRSTFQNISKWMEEVLKYTNSKPAMILIGNKSDLSSSRVVRFQEGRALAQGFQMDFLETSAKTGSNVSEIFHSLTKKMLEKVTSLEKPQNKKQKQEVKSQNIKNMQKAGDKYIMMSAGEYKSEEQKLDIEKIGLSEKAIENLKKNEIKSIQLLLLTTEEDLKQMDLPMGDRIKIRSLRP